MRKGPCVNADQSSTQEAPPPPNMERARDIIACPLPKIKNRRERNMKELTSYNRVAGYLNKIFDLLNFLKAHFQGPPLPSSPRPAHTVTFPCGMIPGFQSWAGRMKSISARERWRGPSRKWRQPCSMRWYTISTTKTAYRIVAVGIPTIIRNSKRRQRPTG